MRCPHCQAELLYRQRGGRKCRVCKRRFALEPKANPLRLHDLRFQQLAEKLSNGGTLRYTAEQMRYAASRKVTASPNAPLRTFLTSTGKLFGSLFPAIFITIFVWFFAAELSMPVAIILSVLILLIGLMVGIYRAMSPTALPMSLKRFQRDVIGRWQKVYDAPPVGLLDEQARQRFATTPAVPANIRAVVVCPAPDILACLHASGVPEQLQVALLPAPMPTRLSQHQQAVLTHLRQHPELPLLVLHDCSPKGCLLPKSIISTLQLRAYHHIIDLGLRPAQVVRQQMFYMKDDPSSAVLKELQKHTASANAPKTPGKQGGDFLLMREEFEWLKKGYYAPLLIVPPARLIRVVSQAVQHTGGAHAAAAPEHDSDEARAEAVGFLSWPAA